RIPPVVEKKHREYIAEILKANGLGDLESEGQDKDGSVISIFDAALSETNAPLRQVKRLVNLFTFNHVIAKTQFTAKDIGGKEVGYNPAIMAGVTALQVLHEETYRKICSGRNRQHRGRILAKLFGAFEPDATVSQDWVSEAPTPELKALWDEQPSTADLVWNPAQDSALEQLRLQVHAIPGRPRTDVSGHDLPVCQYYEQYIQWAAASAPAAPEMKALPKPTYERFEVSRTELDKYPPLDETGKEADPGEWIKENWLGQEWWSDAPLRLSAGGFVWRVMKLDNSDNPTRALLLSEYVIARGPYHGSFESVTWETSDIRQWLNGEFLNRLPEDFRRRVSPGDMVFPENPFYPTHDYVFLLSTQEAADCLISDTTETVIQKAAEMREGLVARLPPRAPYDGLGETRSWYLGPVGAPRVGAPVVNRDGFVHPYDRGVRDARGGVRPALWMNL
ncbi:MAG: DUF6273 domain-containing protein, partial [Propionibacteriaceae bacterium]|nr:DUF6273 domain-containing protein [Propionibacteriaceae bacterium]